MNDVTNKSGVKVARMPSKAPYRGEAPNQANLIARQEYLAHTKRGNFDQIQAHRETHQSISEELSQDLQRMQTQGRALENFEAQSENVGVFSRLLRTFNRRGLLLQRRSMNEDLVRHYESLSRCLRRASVFSDELQLCAIDMRDHIDDIHSRLEEDRHDLRLCAQRILDIEVNLKRLDADSDGANQARLRDQLEFEEKVESGRLNLLRASLAMGKEELAPARALRDTAQEMHREMSELVLQVSAAVRSAGQQIQVLGMAADASLVVAELQESMAQLDLAMEATERYIHNARALFSTAVPSLAEEIQNASGSRKLWMTDDLTDLSREQAKALADRALLEAAEAEVDSLAMEKTL